MTKGAIDIAEIVRNWLSEQRFPKPKTGTGTAKQHISHPENRARMTIDGQLAEAGWLVQVAMERAGGGASKSTVLPSVIAGLDPQLSG